jgi:hypothetical protein
MQVRRGAHGPSEAGEARGAGAGDVGEERGVARATWAGLAEQARAIRWDATDARDISFPFFLLWLTVEQS